MQINFHPLIPSQFRLAERILQQAFNSIQSRVEDLRRILAIQPDGYFLAYHDGEPIGSVCAVDYGAFAYILERTLSLNYLSAPQVILPGENNAAPMLYNQHGFVLQGRLRHMRLSTSNLNEQRNCVYGQTSFAIG